MAKGDKPKLRVTAVLKDDKSVRFDIGAAWVSKISDDIFNLSLDKETCQGIKCVPRAGGKAVVLNNDNAFFQIEPPYNGGGRKGAGSDDDEVVF